MRGQEVNAAVVVTLFYQFDKECVGHGLDTAIQQSNVAPKLVNIVGQNTWLVVALSGTITATFKAKALHPWL